MAVEVNYHGLRSAYVPGIDNLVGNGGVTGAHIAETHIVLSVEFIEIIGITVVVHEINAGIAVYVYNRAVDGVADMSAGELRVLQRLRGNIVSITDITLIGVDVIGKPVALEIFRANSCGEIIIIHCNIGRNQLFEAEAYAALAENLGELDEFHNGVVGIGALTKALIAFNIGEGAVLFFPKLHPRDGGDGGGVHLGQSCAGKVVRCVFVGVIGAHVFHKGNGGIVFIQSAQLRRAIGPHSRAESEG